MAKKKSESPAQPVLNEMLGHVPALAIRALEREMTKHLRKSVGEVASSETGALVNIEIYTMLLFLAEFEQAELSEKDFKALLKKFKCDTPGNLRTYPNLSQSALFEVFGNLGVSRESIRRQLILLAEHGLVERISKGPPFPDQISISKAGGKMMGRIVERLAKDLSKGKAFGYL